MQTLLTPPGGSWAFIVPLVDQCHQGCAVAFDQRVDEALDTNAGNSIHCGLRLVVSRAVVAFRGEEVLRARLPTWRLIEEAET